MTHVLRIDSSARTEGSVSRDLSKDLAARLAGPAGTVTVRDLAAVSPGFVDAAWVKANFTAPEARTDADTAALAASDRLVEELEAADHVVLGVPIYNFAIPASLKAWIDQVARAHRTFRYTATGPEGLLKGKTAWLVVASGGTAAGGELDFATPYLRHVLGFIGVEDVRTVDASRWGVRNEAEKAALREGTPLAGSNAA